MGIGFGEALLVLGGVLVVAAALSGLFHGTVLSISVLSVGLGTALALAGVLEPSPGDETVVFLVELALLLTLFTDGLYAERELLRKEWHTPARALVIALPITLVLLALSAKLLFPELHWAEAFLLGAILAPTDPVVTSTVVTARRVPRLIRHTLNLESGLNDGVALPLVLVFLALATREDDAGSEAASLAGEVVAGAAVGLALAGAAALFLRRIPGGSLMHKYEGVFALGLALAAFGLADVTFGNGLIAAFVAGMALAAGKIDVPEAFGTFNEGVSAAFQVMTFVVFAALIVETDGFHSNVLALVGFAAFALVVARPAAVLLAFVGIELPRPQKLFIAWFGPKGVASMLFALFVINSGDPNRTVVFDVASFVILASILVHGLTDTVGANWIERMVERSGDPQQDDVGEGVEGHEDEAGTPIVDPAEGEQPADDGDRGR